MECREIAKLTIKQCWSPKLRLSIESLLTPNTPQCKIFKSTTTTDDGSGPIISSRAYVPVPMADVCLLASIHVRNDAAKFRDKLCMEEPVCNPL